MKTKGCDGATAAMLAARLSMSLSVEDAAAHTADDATQRTAGVDVNRSLRIAAVEVAKVVLSPL